MEGIRDGMCLAVGRVNNPHNLQLDIIQLLQSIKSIIRIPRVNYNIAGFRPCLLVPATWTTQFYEFKM